MRIIALIFFILGSLAMLSPSPVRLTVGPQTGFAPLKVTARVFIASELRIEGTDGVIVVNGPLSFRSYFPVDPLTPVVTRVFTLEGEGDYEVWAIVGDTATPHQTVRLQ